MTQSYDPHADWAREDAAQQPIVDRLSYEEAVSDALREAVDVLSARAKSAEKRVAELEETLTGLQAAYDRLIANLRGNSPLPDTYSPVVRRTIAETLERTHVEGWMSQTDAVLNTLGIVIHGDTPRGGQR
ncbi:hypothetical protein [Saccharopolyspora taberi]|uniref:Uncharacterized protein n=1 Tax=Saccharopolyspora taberi TaxID=60895 RepID=A0ABN3V0Q3_9PSEU